MHYEESLPINAWYEMIYALTLPANRAGMNPSPGQGKV